MPSGPFLSAEQSQQVALFDQVHDRHALPARIADPLHVHDDHGPGAGMRGAPADRVDIRRLTR